jgi:hypothetical protein
MISNHRETADAGIRMCDILDPFGSEPLSAGVKPLRT